MGSYFANLEDAHTIAAKVPAALITNYLGISETDAEAAILLQASIDVDLGLKYQGRRVDLINQTNEFPRIARESSNLAFPLAQVLPFGFLAGQEVWDIDPISGLAVVPVNVLMAVIHQAEWIQAGGDKQLKTQFAGLKSESMGTASKSYSENKALDTGLCRRALQLLQPYALFSGRIT